MTATSANKTMNSENVHSTFSDAPPEDFRPYRSVSKSAVICLLLGGFSLLALLFPVMLTMPLLGFIFGVQAVFSLKRYPNELTGWLPAVLGLVLCVGLGVGGLGRHVYVYMTEVPEDHLRITFRQLQPKTIGQRIPPSAVELDQMKIFMKGYMHPSGTQGMGDVSQFVLVPDMGTCCFGGQPKLTDMVEVTLTGGLKTRYTRRKKKLAGMFSVDNQLKPVNGLKGVYYQLEAYHVK